MNESKINEILNNLPPEMQEKFKVIFSMLMEMKKKSKPMMEKAKLDLPTKEFNEILHRLYSLVIKVKMVKPDKEQVVAPTLYVYGVKQEDGKRNVTPIMFADFNDDKRKIMFATGKKYGRDVVDEVVAIYFITEVWQAEYKNMKEAEKVRPRDNLNRQEILLIAGLTLDRRVNTVSIPIERTEDGQRKLKEDKAKWVECDEKSDKKFNTKPEILKAFMAGYLEGRIHNGRVKN